jgi:uncharacterized protein DUF5996
VSEFVLPCEEVRLSASPDQMVLSFSHSAYEVGGTLAGWDRGVLERPDPVPRHDHLEATGDGRAGQCRHRSCGARGGRDPREIRRLYNVMVALTNAVVGPATDSDPRTLTSFIEQAAPKVRERVAEPRRTA